MERQQNTQLHTEGTQNQIIRHKALEEFLILDNEQYTKFVEDQDRYSRKVILDTNIFIMVRMDGIFNFIESNQGKDIKEYIENYFFKSNQYISGLDSIIRKNQGLVVTKNIIDEIDKFYLFWRTSLNPGRYFTPGELNVQKERKYFLEVMNKNKKLQGLLKEKMREYLLNLVNIRNFLDSNSRVLTNPNNLENLDFKNLLKHVIQGGLNYNGKLISQNDRDIFYDLFVSSLNHSTGLLSKDRDYVRLMDNVSRNLETLNGKLKKNNLFIKQNYYVEKLFTYVMHIDKE